MLQAQFASVKASAPPASLHPLLYHKRTGKFAEKIFTHGGMYKDTTNPTRAKKREKQRFESTFESMDDLMLDFVKELGKLMKVKDKIVENQKYMGKKTLEYYSAITIQNYYRVYFSKRRLKQLIAARFLTQWYHFKQYFIRRKNAATTIARARRRHVKTRNIHIFLKRNEASRKIQKFFRRLLKNRVFWGCVRLLVTVKRTISHSLLFGQRRALRFIQERDHPELTQYNKAGRIFILACLRKRRLKLLRGPQGKLAFYILSRYFQVSSGVPHNKVIEYLRKRVLSENLVDKKGRRFNFGLKQVANFRGTARFPTNAVNNSKSPTSPSNSYADKFSEKDLPHFFRKSYAPKRLVDVVVLIQDMYNIALANPSYLDDSILPAAPSNFSPNNKKLLGGRMRDGLIATSKQIMNFTKKQGQKTMFVGNNSGNEEGSVTTSSFNSTTGSTTGPIQQINAAIALVLAANTNGPDSPTSGANKSHGGHKATKIIKKDTIIGSNYSGGGKKTVVRPAPPSTSHKSHGEDKNPKLRITKYSVANRKGSGSTKDALDDSSKDTLSTDSDDDQKNLEESDEFDISTEDGVNLGAKSSKLKGYGDSNPSASEDESDFNNAPIPQLSLKPKTSGNASESQKNSLSKGRSTAITAKISKPNITQSKKSHTIINVSSTKGNLAASNSTAPSESSGVSYLIRAASPSTAADRIPSRESNQRKGSNPTNKLASAPIEPQALKPTPPTQHSKPSASLAASKPSANKVIKNKTNAIHDHHLTTPTLTHNLNEPTDVIDHHDDLAPPQLQIDSPLVAPNHAISSSSVLAPASSTITGESTLSSLSDFSATLNYSEASDSNSTENTPFKALDSSSFFVSPSSTIGSTSGMNSTIGSLDANLEEAFGGTIGNIMGTLSHDSYMIAEEEEEEEDDDAVESKNKMGKKPGVKRGASKRLNLSDISDTTAASKTAVSSTASAATVIETMTTDILPSSTFTDNLDANASISTNNAALEFLTSGASGLSSGSSLGISLPEDEINRLLEQGSSQV